MSGQTDTHQPSQWEESGREERAEERGGRGRGRGRKEEGGRREEEGGGREEGEMDGVETCGEKEGKEFGGETQ